MATGWTVTVLTPDGEKAYLKRLSSGDLEVILTEKDAVIFPTRKLAEEMNLLSLNNGGQVEEVQKANMPGISYTPYVLAKYFDTGVLYMHYSESETYSFKSGMRGACIFKEHQAQTFLESMFANDPKVVKIEVKVGALMKFVTQPTQSATDLYVRNAKKRAKKKRQKEKARTTELSQGPEVADLEIGPSF
jgi:hypothetical protein